MKTAQFFGNDKLRLGIGTRRTIQPVDLDSGLIGLIPLGLDLANIRPSEKSITLSGTKLARPVSHPSKIIAIRLNYLEHADDRKPMVQESPLGFAKFSNIIIRPSQDVIWSESVTKKVDFEAELVVAIGKKTRNCPEEGALESVFGYDCGNDVSAWDLRFANRNGQF